MNHIPDPTTPFGCVTMRADLTAAACADRAARIRKGQRGDAVMALGVCARCPLGAAHIEAHGVREYQRRVIRWTAPESSEPDAQVQALLARMEARKAREAEAEQRRRAERRQAYRRAARAAEAGR